MPSDYSSHSTNDSRPSDFNDGAEAILMNTDFGFEDCSRRSTPESHFGCHGYGHGQGGPVYSCGCYKHDCNGFGRFQSEPSSPDTEQACQLADAKFRAEHPELLEAQGGDHNNADAPCSKRKWSEDDGDVTNMRATSVPIVELPPKKRTRIERKSESFEGESLAKIMQEVVGLRDACRVSICVVKLGILQANRMSVAGLQTFIQDMVHYTLSPVRLKASKIGGGSPDPYVSINDREELARTEHKLSMLACRTDWDFSVQARCCEFNESSLLETASDVSLDFSLPQYL
ncbi:hypothetical protein C8R48DRAFT_677346 [Suillus tomentosus]|nr:hypothetical protein C8R48DRAFT_677346 [Suillus tomentosus]